MSTVVESLSLPAGVYALCDDTVAPQISLPEKAELLLQGGIQVMQLRMKRTSGRQAVEVARAIASACRRAQCLCVVNDRVDVALLAGADGVHVGDDDLPAPLARQLLGPRALVGVTVRSALSAQKALQAGASYVGLGPVFPTRTKSVEHVSLGLEGLREVCSQVFIPVVAIAGIGLHNVEDVARAGAHGAAVASDLLCAEDVPARARALAEAFAKGHARAGNFSPTRTLG